MSTDMTRWTRRAARCAVSLSLVAAGLGGIRADAEPLPQLTGTVSMPDGSPAATSVVVVLPLDDQVGSRRFQ
jgi:hypothetical protein